MIALVAIVLVLVVSLAGAAYLLGFQLGGQSSLEERTRMRIEAQHAARQMETVTRRAITAMLDEAQRRRQG